MTAQRAALDGAAISLFNGLPDPARRIAAEENRLSLGPGWLDDEYNQQRPTVAPFRKTTLTYAQRMSEPFAVTTPEGLMSGEAGDWLAVGQAGELYPIKNAIFRASYEPCEPEPDLPLMTAEQVVDRIKGGGSGQER